MSKKKPKRSGKSTVSTQGKLILSARRFDYLFLLFILAASLFLFLFNLGNHYLWQDEAQTALISQTILDHGVPKGTDGRNFFSQELQAEYGDNYIWKWHTWLPFYILSVFFAVLPDSTFVARLPFALFGVGSIFLTYAFCAKLWQNKRIAMIAAILLIFCIPFLILLRQCRYYSLAAFFSLWGLYAYIGILNQTKRAVLYFIIAATLLFHTHYLYCATLLATAVVHCLVFHRNRLKDILLSSIIIALINVPWILWLSGMKYGEQYKGFFDFDKILNFAGRYFQQIGAHVFQPLLLLILPLVIVVGRIKNRDFIKNILQDRMLWSRLGLLLFFIFINLIALFIISPAPFFRYLAPLIPIIIILASLLVYAAKHIHKIFIPVITLVLIVFSPIKDYGYELTHDYDGPIEGIVKYLSEHADPDDMVAITYGDMPLKFYTDLRIIGGLAGEDLSLTAPQARWVIIRRNVVSGKDQAVGRYLMENLPLTNPQKYRPIPLRYPDIRFENREDPAEHHFRTVNSGYKVIIYQKID